MLSKENIEHLATLARISVSDDEKIALAGELEAVLHYVGEISKVATNEDTASRAGTLRNVMREDGDAYAGGEWSEMILANAPRIEGGHFKVEQIM